ncbi:hypothetical protein Tco_0545472 [Tanacetum coccineum]
METKDTLSSCSDSEEQPIQQLRMQAKILKQNSMNKFIAFKTTTQSLKRQTFTTCPLFQQAFAHLFSKDVRTFKFELSQNMQNLERHPNKETLHEKDSKSDLRDTNSSGIVSDKGNDQSLENQNNTSRDRSSGSRNKCIEKSTSGDDMDIRPSYDTKTMAEVPYTAEYNVFAVETQHSDQPENMNDTSLMEKVDSNTTPDSSDLCNNEFKDDQNADDHEHERVVLANLIANLKLETNRTLGEPISTQDSCLIALQTKQKELEKYKAFNDRTIDYDKLKQREQYFEIQDLKAQLQDKNIAISELKKLIGKMKGKSVDTNFKKQSILGKPPLQPIRNQPVSDSQVDLSNNLTKPVTPHSWPQVRKSYFAKPYDVNAPGPSRKSPKHVSFQSQRESVGSNDMVHNYYLEEAKNKAQLQKDKALNTKPSVKQSVRLLNNANEPPRNHKPFLKLKYLACPTCKKCIYSANHDECILKYLLKVGLKWIPIRKSVETRYNTNDSDLPLGKETHNPNTVICANSLSLSAELRINALALSDRHPTYHETSSDQVQMDNPNITMKEYIRLEEEKAHRHGKVYNWETATCGKIWDNKDVHDLGSVETEFPAIVFNDTLTSEAALSCEPTVSSLNNDEIDFRISFDKSDDEDCMVIFDKNSFSYKIISVNDLKIDSENDNDKVNMPLLPSPEPTVSYFDDLDFFKDFENKFSAIVYNDAQTSKSDLLTEPISNPQHIDEFDLKDETSLSECDEEEQNVLNFNDLFPFNVIYPDELKTDTDNDNDKVDIEHSSRDLSVKPLPDVINTDTVYTAYPNPMDTVYRPSGRYPIFIFSTVYTTYSLNEYNVYRGPRERNIDEY